MEIHNTSTFRKIKNLTDSHVQPCPPPWEIAAPDFYSQFSGTKAAFKAACKAPTTEHHFISAVHSQAGYTRISQHPEDVPPYFMAAIVADYDSNLPDPVTVITQGQGHTGLKPSYFARTFSGNLRVVFLFETLVCVAGNRELYTKFIEIASAALNLVGMYPSLDDGALADPGHFYELGVNWQAFPGGHPLSAALVNGWLAEASKKCGWLSSHATVPIEDARARLAEMFPTAYTSWDHLEIGARCRRFWASDASDETACVVTEGGILYFTDGGGFKSWSDLCGPAWVMKFKAELLGEATQDVHFDGTAYWRRGLDGTYVKVLRQDLLLHFRRIGLSSAKARGERTSQVEDALLTVQDLRRVHFAAPLCGRPSGAYQENGVTVLATTSPKIVGAMPGDPSPLEQFFLNLFGLEQDELATVQMEVFLSWLKIARQSLKNPDQHLPGQVLFLCGPKGAGKTLSQDFLTRLLGGRSADPAGVIFGRSEFNGDCWEAEHLALSDAGVKDAPAARRALRDYVKRIAANDISQCHRKHRDAISLRPIWRLTVSANLDSDSAMILPGLDASVADKVVYLQCYPPLTPYPSGDGRKAFYESLVAAIPAFIAALDDYEIPANLSAPRFGVREWHHPALVELLAGAHVDSALADRLEEWLSSPEIEDVVTGTAANLYDRLKLGSVSDSFVRDCRDSLHLGQALHRLSRVSGWEGRIVATTARVGGNRQQQTTWTLRKEAPTTSA